MTHQHDNPMTKERLAYGQERYYSVYDFAKAVELDYHTITRLCLKWQMLGDWFYPAPGQPVNKWRLRPSKDYVPFARLPCRSWHDTPMWASRFEDE